MMPEIKNNIDTFCPSSREAWRQWLIQNHALKNSVWLLQYKKKSAKPSISWSEAVEEALCFGWIDSIRKTIDDETFIQFFSKRKPRGTWSKINKDKIKELIDAKLMSEAGLKSIEIAKENGSWTILDEVEEMIIPDDLTAAFGMYPGAETYFVGLGKSVKKAILQWLVLAKKTETRKSRVYEVAELAARKMRPKHLR